MDQPKFWRWTQLRLSIIDIDLSLESERLRNVESVRIECLGLAQSESELNYFLQWTGGESRFEGETS